MKKKVLIVDDKYDNLYLLESMFDKSEYNIISAKNGAEALGLLKTQIPDLIISDILMPVLDGFTLCRECKKDEILKKIPFFFYTATYTEEKDKQYALSLGADLFIIKPQEPELFLKIIADFLKEFDKSPAHPKEIIEKDESVALKEYNEVLVRKLENKMIQAEKAEKELRIYSKHLEKEIQEHKNAELALKNSQHLFQTLAEVSPVGIFRTKPDGYTTYVNPRWTELSGLTLEKAAGTSWLDAVHPDDRKKVLENWNSKIILGKRSNDEYRFLHKDGSIVWVIGAAVPEMLNSEIAGYIGTITDITLIKEFEAELIHAKEKAEESDRLKTAFLHNISHEIRTPMNAIVGFSNLLTDPDLTQENRNEFISIIVQNSNQLLSIITQIVNMAIIEAGLEKIFEKETSLNSVLKTIYEQFHSEADRKNISLKYNFPLSDNEDNIETDESKLMQIISNLISNALKFTKQGSVDFGYVIKDNYLEFFVKDTGIGIPNEMHEIIFRRFHQIESSLVREVSGSGLGLSISKAYVEMLGGEIWLTSKPEEGSSFYFTIPYKKIIRDTVPEKKVPDENKPENNRTITLLIAEDEYTNFLVICRYLSNRNFVLLHAWNGNEAVEICKNNNRIELVLMDLKMPLMDGFEATKLIKELRPDLPVIAQTAYVHGVDRLKAFTSGCSDFLMKPFKKEELLSMIRKHLNIS